MLQKISGKDQEVNTYDDIFNSATLLDDLTNGISKAIEFDASGIYHIARFKLRE